MVVEDDGEPKPEEEKFDDEKDGPDQLVQGELLVAQVSLATLMGFTHPESMKLMGDIQGRQVVILFDNGASHCFMWEEIILEKQIPMNP